jgi:hypothetical protein
LVPAGTPDQDSGGEMSLPSQVWMGGMGPFGSNALEVRVRGIVVSGCATQEPEFATDAPKTARDAGHLM